MRSCAKFAREQLALIAWSPDPLSLEIVGCGLQDYA